MKCFLVFLSFVLSSISFINAQVGIGNTNPNATLDVSSSNQAAPTNTDGILIPKADNFPVTNPTAAQDGMLLYLTGAGAPTKGFYYWDNAISNWVAVTNSSGWLETGNAGTNSTTNFIGTTDAQDLSFRTNNINKMRLSQKGQLEFFSTGSSIFIGQGAGENDDLSSNNNTIVGHLAGRENIIGNFNSFFGSEAGRNTTSSGNSFFGFRAGQTNNTGANNSFFGSSAGISNNTGNSNSFFGLLSGGVNTSGSSNSFYGSNSGARNTNGNDNSFYGSGAGFNNTTASNNNFFGANSGGANTVGSFNNFIGNNSGNNNTDGQANTAVGNHTLIFNISGNNNVALGSNAGFGLTGGNNNTFLGTESGGTVTRALTGSVFIGYFSGYFESNSNRLYIENSNSSSPLIYGEFDNDLLRVNGTLQVNNPTTTGYSLPNTDGTAGQVLQTDGAGSLTFVDAPDVDTEWSKTGNGGTNSTTNFIGTTDLQSLTFRTNNIEKLRLTTFGQLEFLNTQSSIIIGENAGDTFFNSNQNSVVIGHEAMESRPGISNVILGYNAGNATSLFATQINGCVFIGREAGFNSVTNNRLYIENSNAGPNNALIYGEFDNNLLRTNSEFQVGSPGNAAIDGRIRVFSDAGSAVDINPLVGYVFNEQGINADFRVEGNTVTHLLFADAGLDILKVGRAVTSLTGNGSTVNGATIKYTADFEHQNGTLGSAIGIGNSEYLADIGLSMLGCNGNFAPTVDNSFDLGLPALRWDDVRATNGVIQTSDITEKENISEISYGLNEILQLDPIKFQWKDDYDRNFKLGLSAQQLQQLIPEVVKDYHYEHSEDGFTPIKKQTDLLGVYYSDIIPVLIKAIQEQDEKIKSLEERLIALENN